MPLIMSGEGWEKTWQKDSEILIYRLVEYIRIKLGRKDNKKYMQDEPKQNTRKKAAQNYPRITPKSSNLHLFKLANKWQKHQHEMEITKTDK